MVASNDWMWSEACELLARAERLQQEMFRPVRGRSGRPVWQPPVDVLETNDKVLILMALPGVDPHDVEAVINEGDLAVSGSRVLPEALRTRLFIVSSCRRVALNGEYVCRLVAIRMLSGTVCKDAC